MYLNIIRIPDVSAQDVSAQDVSAKTWRRTFRQKKYAETSQAKKFAGTSRMIYAMYARSPSPSQRPAPTTIASRSPFPLGLCSCSTSLSKMGIYAAPRGRGALEEMGTYPRGEQDVSAKDISAKTWRRTFRQKKLPKRLEFFLPKRLCRNVLFPIIHFQLFLNSIMNYISKTWFLLVKLDSYEHVISSQYFRID